MSDPSLINLTTRPEFRFLMAHEFHQVGSEEFDPTEPSNFLKRLTGKQEQFLLNKVKDGRLTAFITYGDGIIDLPMGADFTPFREDGPLTELVTDSIRPNASFAFFAKTSPGGVELVFYTRFFVINYGGNKDDDAKQARIKLKQLEMADDQKTMLFSNGRTAVDYNKPASNDFYVKSRSDRDDTILLIFNHMKKLKKVHGVNGNGPFVEISKFINANKSPHWRKHYYLKVEGIEHPIGNYGYFPYLSLIDENGQSIIFAKNRLHGLYNTMGCWMLMRLGLWLWPRENEDVEAPLQNTTNYRTGYYRSKYEKICSFQHLVRYHSSYKRYIDYSNDWDSIKNLLSGASGPGKEWEYYANDINYSYLSFINLFAGIKYNQFSDNKGPEIPDALKNVYVKESGTVDQRQPWPDSRPIFVGTGDTYIKLELRDQGGSPYTESELQKTFIFMDDYLSGSINIGSNEYQIKRHVEGYIILNNTSNIISTGANIEFFNSFSYETNPIFKKTALAHEVVEQKKKGFAEVYLFARTDRFTYYANDKKTFE